MSKRMKKLISMLLSMTMILTSLGMVAFADEADTTTDGAQATDAAGEVTPVVTEDPDATPEPTDAAIDAPDVEDTDSLAGSGAEVTPEPAPVSEPVTTKTNNYAEDAYYQRALSLVTALGIFKGDETGSMNEASNVTRAEMSAIVLRMLNTPAQGPYMNGFNDVTSAHWAANEIQTAQTLGIINGFEDGSFRPDGNVTYEQVVKMIVCALGYDSQAKFNGGYPNGYLTQASTLELTDNAYSVVGTPAERGLVIKMVYNALLTKYNEVVSKDGSGSDVREATKTLAKTKFNVMDATGVLTATPSKTIDQSYSELQDGLIVIDGVTYETDLEGLDDYVGTEIVYFYIDDIAILTPTIISLSPKSTSKSSKVIVNLDKVDRLEKFGTKDAVIVMDKGSNYRCPDATINYNGAVITSAMYEKAVRDDKEDKFLPRDYMGEPTSNTAMSFDEFLLPDQGSMEITDTDGDGKYDYIFIESYETMLVTSVSSKTLAGKINNSDRSFKVDTEANQDLQLTVMRNGSAVRARNLNIDDVASVMESLDGNILKFIVTGESITGSVSALGEEDGKYVASINGDTYEIDANAIEGLNLGSDGTFYLDYFGRVGYVTTTGGGRLSGSEMYGWLMNAYKGEDGNSYIVKIFAQDGSINTYELAANVNYWGPKDTESSQLTGNSRNTIAKMVEDHQFLLTTGRNEGTEIRLCKFRVNSSGLVNMLYMATDASKIKNNKAVVVDTVDLRGSTATGSTVNGRIIADGIVGFNVPSNASDMNSDSEYSTFNVSSGTYVSKSNGVERDFIVGEFTNTRDANVLIQFNTSANEAVAVTDYGTASDNPVMVVSSVEEGFDPDTGDTIYYVVGRRNGAAVSYATTSNTSLYRSAPTSFYDGTSSNSSYATVPNKQPIWSATDSTDSIGKYLHPGDIVGVSASGAGAHIFIKFVDVKELADRAILGSDEAVGESYGQFLGYNTISDSRDAYGIGAVADLSTADDTYFDIVDPETNETLKGWVFASSLALDVIEVTTDEDGFVSAKVTKDGYEPSELMNYSSRNQIGDFVFFRHFRYQDQREAFVYRFNDN